MDAFAQLALMAKANLVFASEGTFLSFPALSPLSYPPERLKFAAPGQATPQDLSDLSEFARITNRIPRGVLAPLDDEEHLWDVYDEVLRTARVSAGSMSAEEKARYDEAMSFLYTRSPEGFRQDGEALKAYKRHRDAHITAQEEYKTAQVTAESSEDPAVKAQWTVVEPELRAEVDRLDEEWRTQGRRAEVEAAQQVEEANAARAPSVIWDDWRTSFVGDIDLSTDTNMIEYAVTGFSPYDLFDQGTWPQFTLSNAEMTQLAAQAPPELVSIFGSGSANSNIESVSFEYRSVSLIRPWLRPALFRSRFWRLGNEGSELSDGGNPATGRCPSYITALVFARNVTVDWRDKPADAPPDSETSGRLLMLKPQLLERLMRDQPAVVMRPRIPRPTFARGVSAAVNPGAMRMERRNVVAAPAMRPSSPRLVARDASIEPAVAAVAARPAWTRLSGQTFGEIATSATPRPRIRLTLPPPAAGASNSPAEPPAPPSKDVTILAFICKRLPRCPDPDPSLTWS